MLVVDRLGGGRLNRVEVGQVGREVEHGRKSERDWGGGEGDEGLLYDQDGRADSAEGGWVAGKR